MSDASPGRAVFSIVAVAGEPVPPAGAAVEPLRAQVVAALQEHEVAAEAVTEADGGVVLCFRNSTAALDFARAIVARAGAEQRGGCRAAVHMGAMTLGARGESLAQPAAARATMQLLRLARPGQVLVSQLFYNIVSQFDHRCKAALKAVGQATDPSGRVSQVFELHTGDDSLAQAAAAPRRPREDSTFLPIDPARRIAFLAFAEQLLAREIGPMAKLVVQQAQQEASTKLVFCQRITASLRDRDKAEALMQRLLAENEAR